MWYKKRIAVDVDTGDQFPVFMGTSYLEDDLSPTLFFKYFSDVPVHNTINQCLDVLDITELINDLYEEKIQGEAEGIPDSRIYETNEREGVGFDSANRKEKKEWKKNLKD